MRVTNRPTQQRHAHGHTIQETHQRRTPAQGLPTGTKLPAGGSD